VAPLASKPSPQAMRMLCRANLGKIGQAMFIYANDYEGELPRAGGRSTVWGGPVAWSAFNRYTAYGLSATGEGGMATISSCFYLLVKYVEMPPRQFVCPSDIGTSEFKLGGDVPVDLELADAWDFGSTPSDNCSYAYHIPFGQYALTTSRDPDLPVAADRSPWIRSPAADVDTAAWSLFLPDIQPFNGTIEAARRGNAVSHEKDGQNVLFLDGRVTFEHRSFCGFAEDNIYTISVISGTVDPKGRRPVVSPSLQPSNEKDSLLVHDPGPFGAPRSR